MYVGDNLLLKQVTLNQTCELRPEGQQLCFLLVKQGKCKYLNEHVSHVLSSGDWLIFSKSQHGQVEPEDKKGTTAVRFLVGLDQLSSLLGTREIALLEKVSGRLRKSRHLLANTPLARQCQALLEGAPVQQSLEHRSQLLRIAATMLSEEFRQVKEQEPPSEHANGDFASVLSRLSLEDVQNNSVEELAKKLGYSRRHLNRLFHEHLGISASDLKMEVRLLKSLSLLRNPTAKVIDVALECGFNHLGLFSQCFKRRFQVSPNQWRQRELVRSAPEKNPAELAQPNCQLVGKGMCLWNNLKTNGNGELAEGHACQVALHPALCQAPEPPRPRAAA